MRLSIFAFVLALSRDKLKRARGLGANSRVADKLKQVSFVAGEIAPSKNNFTTLWLELGAEVEFFVKEECLFVFVSRSLCSAFFSALFV